MNRRTVLRWAIGIGLTGIAGCMQSGSNGGAPGTETDDSEPSPEPTNRPTDTQPPMTEEPETPTASPTASSTPSPTDSPTPTTSPTPTATPSPSPTPTVEPDVTVNVAPDGRFRFNPDSFEVASGGTVQWIWRGGGHNVKPESTPGGSDWSGTPGEEFDTFQSGYTYTHTFDVPGEYEYYCAPHRSSGMVGSFTVTE